MQEAVAAEKREDAVDDKVVVVDSIVVTVDDLRSFVAGVIKQGEVVGIPFVVLSVASHKVKKYDLVFCAVVDCRNHGCKE